MTQLWASNGSFFDPLAESGGFEPHAFQHDPVSNRSWYALPALPSSLHQSAPNCTNLHRCNFSDQPFYPSITPEFQFSL